MKKTLASLAAGLAALIVLPASAQQDFSKVEIKATKVTDRIYMLEGSGGNIGVSAGEDSVFVIDDQYAPLTAKIQAAVAQITSKPVQFVFNTHWHGDHAGGNENFGKANAVIVAHENVRKRLSTDQFIELFKMKSPASPKVALPVVTFTTAMTFHLNGEDIRVMHVPRAHTDGDSIVYFAGSDVLHMGDLFFNGMYPFIDASSGGSLDGVIAGCDQALAMIGEKTKVIPGHGPLGGRADLKAYRDMLVEVRTRFQKAVAGGKSAEDIAKAGLTKDLDAKWGQGFMKPDYFAAMIVPMVAKPK